MPEARSGTEEFTVDELASRAGMTVRNVRAYASRGLIAAPRLEGRTGYYSREHLQRLQLIRQLLDRGYTLAAVEKAVLGSRQVDAAHALDLIALLDAPSTDTAVEEMSRDDLAALAGVGRDDALIDAMVEHGLAERVDDVTVRLLEPTVVRSGAAAVALGLAPETVIALFPVIRTHVRAVADTFVREVVGELIQPFIDAGFPEDEWPRILGLIESLLPIASQVTLGAFRSEFRKSIDVEVGEQISELASRGDTR